MKIRNVILATCLLLLTSCVVKSLHPFFTEDTVYFDEKMIGTWNDNDKGQWKIFSFEKKRKKYKSNQSFVFKGSFAHTNTPAKKEDIAFYEENKKGYIIYRTNKEGNQVNYLANTFKINNQSFIDIIPLGTSSKIDELFSIHTIPSHSLAKIDFSKSGEMEIKWLDQEKIEDLFKDKKIKIKHEKVGAERSEILLTAKSKNLQKFIKKYMASKDSDKWGTSFSIKLKKLGE